MAIALHALSWERKITVALAYISIGIMLDKMRLANNGEQGRGEIVHNAFVYSVFQHNGRMTMPGK